jgi:hypothetical protein
MSTPKKTAWVIVDGPVLDPKKKYTVRVKDEDEEEWKDDWVVIKFDKTAKKWEPMCGCDDNRSFGLSLVTHYLELPE